VVIVVAIAAAAVHAAVAEPRFLLADDLAILHLPFQRYTYAHPFDAVRGLPAPPTMFGTQTTIPDLSQDVTQPLLYAALAVLAPRDLLELASFEWHVTSVYVALSVIGAAFALRRLGVSRPLALAVAALYPFFVSVGAEYTFMYLHRAKLFLPLVLIVTLWAWSKRSVLAGLAAGAAWAFCLGHAWHGFWIPVMAVVWASAYAWRRASHDEGVARRPSARDLWFFAAAALVLIVALGRGLLGFRSALAASAWDERLAASGARQIAYLTAGADWLPSAGAASAVPSTAAPGGGINVVLAAGLSLLAALAVLAAVRRSKTRSSFNLGAPAVAALVTACAAIPILALERLPTSAYSSEGSRAFVYGVPLPIALVTLGHVAERSWLPMFELSATVAAAIVLSRWAGAARSARRRAVEIVLASVLYAVVLRLLGGREPLLANGDALLAAEVVACVLALVALTGHERPGPRLAAAIALPILAFGFATTRWPLFLEHRAGASRGKAVREVVARVDGAPAETKGRADYRLAVVGEPSRIVLYVNAAHLFESGGTTTYGATRTMRRSLITWFESLQAIDTKQMPYAVTIDYARLDALGVLPLLGVRWWLAAEVDRRPAFLPPETPGVKEIAPGLYEDARALPKARPLRRVHASVDRDRDLERLLEIGARGATATEGIVHAAAVPEALGDDDRVTVEIADVRPGAIVVTTHSPKPFVVATTELTRPGWSIALDGASSSAAPIVEVDGAFVGVEAPAGDHRLELRLRIGD